MSTIMIETLADALLQNGCSIKPHSTNAGQPFGQQPAGFICEGQGFRALGPTIEKAAENWVSKFSPPQTEDK